eukprot:2395270-Amphidinium_carterae.1
MHGLIDRSRLCVFFIVWEHSNKLPCVIKSSKCIAGDSATAKVAQETGVVDLVRGPCARSKPTSSPVFGIWGGVWAFLGYKDKRVIVIGGGDTAVDCVATAVRLGAKS